MGYKIYIEIFKDSFNKKELFKRLITDLGKLPEFSIISNYDEIEEKAEFVFYQSYVNRQINSNIFIIKTLHTLGLYSFSIKHSF